MIRRLWFCLMWKLYQRLDKMYAPCCHPEAKKASISLRLFSKSHIVTDEELSSLDNDHRRIHINCKKREIIGDVLTQVEGYVKIEEEVFEEDHLVRLEASLIIADMVTK